MSKMRLPKRRILAIVASVVCATGLMSGQAYGQMINNDVCAGAVPIIGVAVGLGAAVVSGSTI